MSVMKQRLLSVFKKEVTNETINLAMKKLITANGLNPKDYWFLKNTIDSLVIIHKETSKVITLKKCKK